jgi:hypothetical protein
MRSVSQTNPYHIDNLHASPCLTGFRVGGRSQTERASANENRSVDVHCAGRCTDCRCTRLNAYLTSDRTVGKNVEVRAYSSLHDSTLHGVYFILTVVLSLEGGRAPNYRDHEVV